MLSISVLLPTLATAEETPHLKLDLKVPIDSKSYEFITPYLSGIPIGKAKWEYNYFDANITTSPIISPDGTIYVGTENKKLYAINPDGTKRREISLGSTTYVPAAFGSDGTIYAASIDGNVYAIDQAGNKKWEFARGGSLTAYDCCMSFERYRYKSPVVGADDTIYVGGATELYALNPDGTKQWVFPTGGEVYSPTVGSDGTIYVGTEKGDLYAIKPNGKLKWLFRTPQLNTIFNSPVLGADGTVYVESFSSSGDTIFSINTFGSEKWSKNYQTYSTPTVGTDDILYIWSDMKLLAIHPNGAIKWGMETGKPYLSKMSFLSARQSFYPAPVVGRDKTIYAAGADGTKIPGSTNNNLFYAIDSDGKVKWQYFAKGFGLQSPSVGSDGTVYMVSEKSLFALGTDATSVNLNKKAMNLQSGDSETLTAAVVPDAALNKKVKWTSSDSTVAKVDNEGKVTGIEPGTAKITVSTEDGGFIAVCAVTVTPSSKPAASQDLPFSDIADHWAKANIIKAVELRIANGYPDFTFRPDGNVTRAEFAVLLMNGMKPAAEGAKLAFADQDKIGEWAVKAVSQAVQLGIVSGYPDGTFQPDSNITHAEMIAMVVRASGLPVDEKAQSGFADDTDIPAWAKGAAAAAKKSGIADFMRDNRFAADNKTTRAEAVTAILAMLGKK